MTATEAEKISSAFINELEIKFTEFITSPEFNELIDQQIKNVARYGKESHHVGNIAFWAASVFWTKSFPDDMTRNYVRNLYEKKLNIRLYQSVKTYLGLNGYTIVDNSEPTLTMVYWGFEAAHVRYKAGEETVASLNRSKKWFGWKFFKSCLSKN